MLFIKAVNFRLRLLQSINKDITALLFVQFSCPPVSSSIMLVWAPLVKAWSLLFTAHTPKLLPDNSKEKGKRWKTGQIHAQTHQQIYLNMTNVRMTLQYACSLHECRYKSTSKLSTLQQISLRGGQHKEMKERKRHLCWLWVAQHVLLQQTPI